MSRSVLFGACVFDKPEAGVDCLLQTLTLSRHREAMECYCSLFHVVWSAWIARDPAVFMRLICDLYHTHISVRSAAQENAKLSILRLHHGVKILFSINRINNVTWMSKPYQLDVFCVEGNAAGYGSRFPLTLFTVAGAIVAGKTID